MEESMVKKLLQIFEVSIGARKNSSRRTLLLSSILTAYVAFCPPCGKAAPITQEKLNKIIKSAVDDNDGNNVSLLIKKKASAVVLIHTFSLANDDHLIYNSSVKKRLKAHHYRHGVISGVVISENGVICTTANGILNANRFVVSVDSEFRAKVDDNNLVLTEDDYVADVIKIIPELNLAFLKITPKEGTKLEFIELGNDGALVNNGDCILLNSAVVIGKCRGENFVTESRPCNSKNNFGLSAELVEKVSYRKESGKPILLLENHICGSCVIPENDGGGIIDTDTGKLLGIAFVNYDDFSIQRSAGIPVSVIKQGVKIAVPSILDNATITHIGVDVTDAKNINVDQKSLSVLNIDKKPDKLGVKVTGIEMDSAAENSGVRVGDVILKFNEEVVSDCTTFDNLEKHSIGMQTVTLTILRGDKIVNLEINR
jgi:S1-C subfamily serine protease